MKKIKLLTPILGLTAIAGAIAPLASCSCGKTVDEGAKANVTVSSTDGVTVKEQSVELNKDSTVTLIVPDMKAIRTVYVHVGTVVLVEDRDFTVDYNENIVKINGSVLKDKDIEITVFTTKQEGITAEQADSSKKFEALTQIKASDINVYPTYEDSTKAKKPLTYGTEYLVYDTDGVEVKDFDSVGYTVTRPDGKNAYKEFVIEYVPFDRYSCKVKVNTEPKLEPESIDSIDFDQTVFKTNKILPKDLIVNATMTKGEPATKILEYGVDYTVWDGDTELTNFGTDGYIFESEGSKELTIKTNVPGVDKKITFTIQPEQYKNTLFIVNDDTAEATVDISGLKGTFKFSINKSDEWTVYTSGDITIPAGGNVAIKGNITEGGSNHISISSSSPTANTKLYGNILGLLDEGQGELFTEVFNGLFWGNKTITYIAKKFLPSTKLAISCYSQMFGECTSLVSAPELPAQKLENGCYTAMFPECTSLVNVPELPSTTLAEYCYTGMFRDCYKLKKSPKLPATELTKACYNNMFQNCTSLTEAPELPSTTLADSCYNGMFWGCTNLKQAPKLPATELTPNCYKYMFQECSNLTTAPELPATKLVEYCYNSMFCDCTKLTTVPILSAKSLAKSCYGGMFGGCTKLTTAPELPATELAQYCYSGMFQNTAITTAPELPATTLADSCYYCMFEGCANLTTPPTLPAKELTDYAYAYMFEGCKKLKINNSGAGTAFFTYLDDTQYKCTWYMFKDTGGEYTSDPVLNETYYYE